MNTTASRGRRTYTQTARAESTARTRAAIVESAITLLTERLSVETSLEDIADRAGISVRTLLRHYGNREALLDAAGTEMVRRVREERQAAPGDPAGAIEVLLAHYEERGDLTLRMLAQEGSQPWIAEMTSTGKQVHRSWVEEVFAADLEGVRGTEREALTDLLVVATDVYTWKLLRRDRGLSRARTAERILHLVEAVRRPTRPPATEES